MPYFEKVIKNCLDQSLLSLFVLCLSHHEFLPLPGASTLFYVCELDFSGFWKNKSCYIFVHLTYNYYLEFHPCCHSGLCPFFSKHYHIFVSHCFENVYIYFLLKLFISLILCVFASHAFKITGGKRRTLDNQGLKFQ